MAITTEGIISCGSGEQLLEPLLVWQIVLIALVLQKWNLRNVDV